MGPKKQKGKKDEEADLSTEELLALYKKYCKESQIPFNKVLEAKIKEQIEGGGHLQEILINERIGEEGAIEIGRALKAVNKGEGYKHLQAIRIWDGDFGDQGVGAFYRYLSESKGTKVSLIEFLNCKIGELGCEFISRILDPILPISIKILTLDYNEFGNRGLSQLMYNLKNNFSINYLSLNYCGITTEGVEHFKDLFDNPVNQLQRLFLQGNNIGNKGASELFNYVMSKQEFPLIELNLNSTGLGKDQDMMINLLNCMNVNLTLGIYHFKYNFFSEKEFRQIVETLEKHKSEKDTHIYQFHIDEQFSTEIFSRFFATMKGRKPPKKKKAVKKKK